MLWRKKGKPRRDAKRGGRTTYDWMVRLAERLNRRDRLRQLDAPETIIESEERLVAEGMSMLTLPERLFVLWHRRDLVHDFDPEGVDEGPRSSGRPGSIDRS
jgi:hypothetical protein